MTLVSFSSGDTQKFAGEGVFLLYAVLYAVLYALVYALVYALHHTRVLQNLLFTCTNDGLYCVGQDEEEGGFANPSSLQCGSLDGLAACKQFVVVLCAESWQGDFSI